MRIYHLFDRCEFAWHIKGMSTIRSSLLSTTHKVMLGVQVAAATLQSPQAAEPHVGDDRFDKDVAKTEVMATRIAVDTTRAGDGKTISWLDAVSGLSAADSLQNRVLQDLTALNTVRLVHNSDSTLTITNVPAHLRVAENMRVMAGWAEGGTQVITEGRREIQHTGAKAPVAMEIDKDLLSSNGQLKVKLPSASANEAMPDVVSLTIYKDDGDGYLLPLSFRTAMTADSLDVPDPLGAIKKAAKKNPTFSLDSLRVTDVQQGAVGSCYFLASAAGLITRDQSLADRAVAVDGNRMWVKFQQPTAPTKSMWVLSDADQNQGVQARRLPKEIASKDSLDVMWPVVFEKAWMTMSKGHDYRRENGGDPSQALRALGVESVGYTIGQHTDSTVFSRIDAGDVYVATTAQAFAADRKSALNARGIVASHAYTVLGADADKGTIDLYNPWGRKLTITIGEFREAFAYYYEKKPPLPAHLAAAPTTGGTLDGR